MTQVVARTYPGWLQLDGNSAALKCRLAVDEIKALLATAHAEREIGTIEF